MRARVYTDVDLALERDPHGVIHVRAESDRLLHRGLGIAHGTDRALQLAMMRILGRGRAAGLLDKSLVEVDRFFRRMAWDRGAEDQADALSPEARSLAEAYVAGINQALARSTPWELRLLGIPVEEWRIGDSVLIARMTGYLTMAQSQGEIERLLVQMVRAGVDDERLEELFPGLLAGLDRELIGSLRLAEPVVPDAVRWASAAPRMMSSNSWVVSGERTASGAPMLCNDPHLEVNRLPAIWYEVALETPDRFALAGTMPGLPGLLVARSSDLSWGATYSFADCSDAWIEHVKDRKVRRGDRWVELEKRTERIERKGAEPLTAVFYDTDTHGVIEGDPAQEGYLLATRWSGAETGARSLEAMLGMWRATGVEEGMDRLGRLESSFNWVLADRHGRIGYQMSGAIPIRKEGWRGLVPLPGWDPANDWRGLHDPEDLPRSLDPEAGLVVTANDDLNPLGRADPINMAMGPYRAERIAELIEASPPLGVEEMRRIQLDVYSKQAERFMAVLGPLLPDSADGRALRRWDCRYDAASLGADPFERFYAALRHEVFGSTLGRGVVGYLESETGMFADFYAAFDRVLLAERSAWFGGRSRDELFRDVAQRSLTGTPRRWGDRQRFVARHLLFGGRLPRLLGFDRGPLTLVGGRATPRQGQLYRSGGRDTSFAPSFRFVTDMSESCWHSILAGGPSDRRFSKWYASELEDWGRGTLKRVCVAGTEPHHCP